MSLAQSDKSSDYCNSDFSKSHSYPTTPPTARQAESRQRRIRGRRPLHPAVPRAVGVRYIFCERPPHLPPLPTPSPPRPPKMYRTPLIHAASRARWRHKREGRGADGWHFFAQRRDGEHAV